MPFSQGTQCPGALGCSGPYVGTCVKSKLTDPGQSQDYTTFLPEFCPFQQWASCNHSQVSCQLASGAAEWWFRSTVGKGRGLQHHVTIPPNIKPQRPQHHHPPLCSQCRQQVSGSGTCWRPWQVQMSFEQGACHCSLFLPLMAPRSTAETRTGNCRML